MAAAEGASLGPWYAPPDPTLPEPWIGLIEGSYGLMYYWNPETNITQYEKPTAVSPPMCAPGTKQQNGIPYQQTCQMFTTPEQQMSPQQGYNQQVHCTGYQQRSRQDLQQFSQHQDHRAAFPQREDGSLVQNQCSRVNPVKTPPAQNRLLVQNQRSHVNPFKTPPARNRPLVQNQRLHVNLVKTPPAHNGPLVQNQPSDVNTVQTPPTENALLVLNQTSDVQTPPTQNSPLFQNQHSDVTPIQTPLTQNGSLILNQPLDVNPIQTPPTHYGPLVQNQTSDVKPVKTPPTQLQQPSASGQQHGPMFQNETANVIPVEPKTEDNQPIVVKSSSYGGPSCTNSANPAVMASLDAMTLSSVDIHRQKHDITATGDNVPAPFMSFESTGFPPELLREIYAAGFASPTPIQAQTWPIALQNRDIVTIAKTGSCKTLGYLIPAFMLLKYCNNNPQLGPTVVILAPTRELATQIQDEAIRFGQFVRTSCICLHSGAPNGPQLKDLERGAHIVVASPGRLNDILEMRKLDLCQVSLLVLDEADRMLDMGFESQIRKIVHEIPPQRQTLMYTSTWPEEVRKIATDLLVSPVQVNIGNQDEVDANNSFTQVNIGNEDELAAKKSITQVNLGNADELAANKSTTQEIIGNADELAAKKSNTQGKHGSVNIGNADELAANKSSTQVNIGNADELAANKSSTQVNIGNADELDANKSITPLTHCCVNIGNKDELAANKFITQHVEVVPHMERQRRVELILRSEERGSKIIIFCSSEKICDQLRRNFGAAAIYGDTSQGVRDWVLNQFRSGKSPILVATDVAARGLDIEDVRVVINYDFPNGVEDYIHRIGRTGRTGEKRVAYTFFSEQDWKHAPDLVKVLEEDNQPVPHEVREIATRGGPSFGKDQGVTRDDDSTGCGIDSRDGGFGGSCARGRGGMSDARFSGCIGGFGGRVGMRDGGFSGRGGLGSRGGQRDGWFGGRGGMRDGGFGGRGGGREGSFGGRGGPRGVGLGGSDGGCDRNDQFRDSHGGGRGYGKRQFDNSGDGDCSMGLNCSHSRSRSRSRSWNSRYSRSSSRSRSWSRSRSHTPVRRGRSRERRFDNRRYGVRSRVISYSRSQSQSRSRSWCRSYSRSSGHSWSCSRSPRWSRSRSRTPVRSDRHRESRCDNRSRGRSYSRSPSRGRSYSHSCGLRSYSRSSSGGRSPRSRSRTSVKHERRRESYLIRRKADLPVPLTSEDGTLTGKL